MNAFYEVRDATLLAETIDSIVSEYPGTEHEERARVVSILASVRGKNRLSAEAKLTDFEAAFPTSEHLEHLQWLAHLEGLSTNRLEKHAEASQPEPSSVDIYPNPFNPATTIEYTLTDDARVRLSVFDLLGREVRALVNETRNQVRTGSYLMRAIWRQASTSGGSRQAT